MGANCQVIFSSFLCNLAADNFIFPFYKTMYCTSYMPVACLIASYYIHILFVIYIRKNITVTSSEKNLTFSQGWSFIILGDPGVTWSVGLGKTVVNAWEISWDATLNKPVPQFIQMLILNLKCNTKWLHCNLHESTILIKVLYLLYI